MNDNRSNMDRHASKSSALSPALNPSLRMEEDKIKSGILKKNLLRALSLVLLTLFLKFIVDWYIFSPLGSKIDVAQLWEKARSADGITFADVAVAIPYEAVKERASRINSILSWIIPLSLTALAGMVAYLFSLSKQVENLRELNAEQTGDLRIQKSILASMAEGQHFIEMTNRNQKILGLQVFNKNEIPDPAGVKTHYQKKLGSSYSVAAILRKDRFAELLTSQHYMDYYFGWHSQKTKSTNGGFLRIIISQEPADKQSLIVYLELSKAMGFETILMPVILWERLHDLYLRQRLRPKSRDFIMEMIHGQAEVAVNLPSFDQNVSGEADSGEAPSKFAGYLDRSTDETASKLRIGTLTQHIEDGKYSADHFYDYWAVLMSIRKWWQQIPSDKSTERLVEEVFGGTYTIDPDLHFVERIRNTSW